MSTNILRKKVLFARQQRQPHPYKERIRKLGLCQTDFTSILCCKDCELSKWLNYRHTMPWSAEQRLGEILDKLEAEVANDE